MQYSRFYRTTHKWLGVIFSVALLNISVTGLLLLEKKNFTWIQPETKTGASGSADQFITNQRLFDAVLSQKHADFKTVDDIDRVDFRPGKRLFKVRSKNNYAEIQVDAITADVLSVARRNSDMIETLHDGSIFGAFTHQYLMPATAVITLYLTATGLYLWLLPAAKRRAKRKLSANS